MTHGTDVCVSVVMSVHDDADRVAKAVASILDQTFRDLELIVVDDGSTDGSGEVLDRLALADPRLRVIHQANAGLTRALIRGCSMARGEFIARQDSDDWSHPKRVESQLALILSDARIGFVSCSTQYVGPHQEPLMTVIRTGDPESSTRSLLFERQGPPAHGSVLFRRALYQQVGGYREEFYFSQDSDLWMRMGEKAWIGYLPEVLYVASRQVDSTSGARRAEQRCFGELTHRCREARLAGMPERPWLDQARDLAEELALRKASGSSDSPSAVAAAAYFLGSQLSQNRDPRARAYLWQAIRAQPTHWKAWIRLAQSYFSGTDTLE